MAVGFENLNVNPKNKLTTDCVIRAITLATGKNYNQVLDEIIMVTKKTGYFISDKKCYEKYLMQLGFVKNRQPRKVDGGKYTIGELDKVIGKNSTAIVSCAHHLTCIKNGVCCDVWDCRHKSCGNYWELSK